MFRSALAFMKKETVLSAAAALALLSMFLVPPDAQYAGYIDFDTLALLFSLMAVMKGYSARGSSTAWAAGCSPMCAARAGCCWRWCSCPSYSAW